MPMLPAERSMARLRKLGYLVAKVERWNAHVKRTDGGMGIRQDLFGILDVLAVKPGQVLGVQCCGATGGSYAAHVRKITDHPNTRTWLASGSALELHGWVKRVRRTGVSWELRIITFELGEPESLGELVEASVLATETG